MKVVWLSLLLLLTASQALLPSLSVWPYRSRPYDIRLRWEHCLKSHVDIAANNSVADYGALISQELGKLAAAGGGSVRLLNGAYTVKSPIIFKDNTCLLGQSLNGVVIKVIDDAPLSPVLRGVLHGINVQNVTARDFTLDVNKDGQDDKKCLNEFTKYGTYFEASSFIYFTNTRVINACAYGYDFPGNNQTFSSNVVLEKSFADSSGKDGIKIYRMLNTSILSMTTLNNGRHGIHIAGSNNILLEGNTLVADAQKDSYKGCGVLITDREGLWTDGVIARYNRIHNFYRAGFCLESTRWVGLIDSTITNLRRKKALCYEMEGAEDVTIIRGSCSSLDSDEKIEKMMEESGASEADVADAFEGATNNNNNNSSTTPPGMTRDPAKCADNEIEASGVCCPGICGKCGGKGCHGRAPYKACCINAIRSAGNKCGVDGPAPCNL